MGRATTDLAEVITGFDVHNEPPPWGHTADNMITRNRAATATVLNHQSLTAANSDGATPFDLYSGVLRIVSSEQFLCDHIGQKVAISDGG